MSTRTGTGCSFGRRIRDDDELGRLGAADGYAEQCAHPEFLHVLALQDLAGQPLFPGHFARGFGHFGRSQPVRRLIGQGTREVLGLAHNAAAADAGFHRSPTANRVPGGDDCK